MRWLGAATVAVLLTACAATPTQESVGEYVDDTAITAHVKSALVSDKQVSALDVGVETFKGVVQLSGFVNSAQEKEKAAEIARTVKGVKAVENDLHVK
jgi:osmotically-inducible protein OsmY